MTWSRTHQVITKLTNQENWGTKRHSEKLVDDDVEIRVVGLFLAGETRHQGKCKHNRADPVPPTGISLPISRKVQGINFSNLALISMFTIPK